MRRRGRRTGARKTRVARMPRYTFVRTTNANEMTSFEVDGAIMVKTTKNFIVQVPAGGALGDFTYGTFSYQFLLEEMHNYTEFTNLFDQYRLNWFKITMTPMATGALTSDAVNGATARIGYVNAGFHWVTDYDDTTEPAASSDGIDVLMQYPNYRTKRLVGGKPIVITVKKPAILKDVYAGVTTAYEVDRKKIWLDIAYTDAVHYGIKGIVEVGPCGGGTEEIMIPFRVSVKTSLSFKNVR